MKNVLFIDCCIRKEKSRTKILADKFLKEIDKNNFKIKTLSLLDENLKYFTQAFLQERESLLAKSELDNPRFKYAHEFSLADKIIIAAPFWDLSFPALLKVYIENICVEGITFGCNDEGCFGLCKADHLVYITSRGGIYGDGDMEIGYKTIKAMAKFWGIEKTSLISAEGLDLDDKKTDSILNQAFEKIKETAKEF